MQNAYDNSVDEASKASYVNEQLIKFYRGELEVINKHCKFFCHFCPNEIKKGDRKSLEMHALARTYECAEIKDWANHKALAHYLFGNDLPPSKS